MAENIHRLAVLIDADNVPRNDMQYVLTEISKLGTASIRRAYGDWSNPSLARWKNILHTLAIQPMQQFAYTIGKNATDSLLIIDALDLLYTAKLDGFCIISSDSDFTPLATRLREAGVMVYGFGERKTPEPFRAACDMFKFIEVLRPESKSSDELAPTELPAPLNVLSEEPASMEQTSSPNELPVEQVPVDPARLHTELEVQMRAAVTATMKESGWSPLGVVGAMLLKRNTSFDPRNYGYSRLGELVRSQEDYLEIKEVPAGDNSLNTHMHIRLKTA
jgi:hypothetical protein